MNNKEVWPGEKVTKGGNLEREEHGDEIERRKIEEERRKMEDEEKKALLLKNPPQIFITTKQLKKLEETKNGEVVLTGIDLHKRELKPGDEIILLDENMVKISVKFVKSTITGRSVTVRR